MKLFCVYFGGKIFENDFVESHDIVFVVAEGKEDAKRLAKWKTKLKYDLHQDGIIEIKKVDGWKIGLAKDVDSGDEMVIENRYMSL